MSEGKTIQEWITAQRTCHVCKTRYTNSTIGSWDCREHFGMIKDGVFLCCGTPCGNSTTTMTLTEYYSTYEHKFGMVQGCIKADHNELNAKGTYCAYSNQHHTKGNGIIDMDEYTAKALGCNPQSIVPIPSSSATEVSVYRFDKSEYAKRKKQIKGVN
jgi:hypothetical protein